MTFRPSVLPDRDNDIISTFTRSFESARNLVRQDQADKRARILFGQQTRQREQDLEDQKFDAAVRSGGPGTFDPERSREQRPGVVAGQDIAAALSGREPVNTNLFAGELPGQERTAPEGQPRLIDGQPGLPNIFAQAGQETRATAGAQPSLIAGVGGAPEVVTPPEFGVGGVGVITEPASREERLEPGFLPEGDLPDDAVRLPGGRMFSENLRRIQERREGAADIGAVGEAEDLTPAGQRLAAGEGREVTEFEDRSPSQITDDVAQAGAFLETFGDEIPASIPRDDELQIIAFGEMLARQREITARNEGLGSTSGRQREQNIQRIVDDLRNEAGFEEGVPPGPEGQALLDRWRAQAEAQVDASAEADISGEGRARTEDLVNQADLAALSEGELTNIQTTASAFLSELETDTRGLSSIQEDLDNATGRERRVIETILLEGFAAKWTDPVAPWSDPENRPGVGFRGFGGRPGGDVFAEARSPQDIVDILFQR